MGTIGGWGGLGGETMVEMAVEPGQQLQINVGGQGASPSGQSPSTQGGFNGGGAGGSAGQEEVCCWAFIGGGGGGASDVRIGEYTLADRILTEKVGECTGGGVEAHRFGRQGVKVTQGGPR